VIEEIAPEQMRERLASPTPPLVVDVREPWELEISRLPGTLDIPMGELATRVAEIDSNRAIIVMCRSGGRSRSVANFLVSRGYPAVANLTGGILAWGERIDPSLRPY
jgi:sulfur-carrier protein adenylyltransferase/sulfurtransferase